MNRLQQFMAITGTALIITSCQDSNTENRDTNAVADQQNVVDTIPQKSDATTSQYVDLKTGAPVDLYYDPASRMTYSAVTNEPIEFYIDVPSGDTIYGRGRYVVNNYVIKADDGVYKLNADKIKIDKDEIKIKDGDKKFKMDNSTMKLKDGNSKMKADSISGKIKTGDLKKKMEGDRSKTKSN
ncbi:MULTISPECIES: hypothetical protein [Niastella]|uniref:LPS export ABC transporter periplasmic protein LptC n=1 Tax=Niastella soli TaxID=2821487 RepID=A0ABS3YR29_9BACT|nr:hypothetical protein [Niastella soli]MBO9200037.1 hypothetical protein [Niastella soli]